MSAYVRVTWEEECSQYTPGAYWVPGGEYYAVTVAAWVPAEIVARGEEDGCLAALDDSEILWA